MFQRWLRWVVAAFLIAAPLASEPARVEGQSPVPAKNAAKKHAKPGAKGTKPGKKAASGSRASAGPGAMAIHPPPTPHPTSHTSFDIPQAKTLAETSDVVLNQKVKASLMSALTVANEQEITSETVKGVVTLTGTVKSPQFRARAEQVARKVPGVHAVKNRLKVK